MESETQKVMFADNRNNWKADFEINDALKKKSHSEVSKNGSNGLHSKITGMDESSIKINFSSVTQ